MVEVRMEVCGWWWLLYLISHIGGEKKNGEAGGEIHFEAGDDYPRNRERERVGGGRVEARTAMGGLCNSVWAAAKKDRRRNL